MKARGIFLPISFLLFPILLSSAAEAVQTGGSISLYPTDWGRLVKGSLVDVVVAVNNTSSDTPATDFPDGVSPVAAKLSGGVTILLACADADCTTQVAGKLKFVPVGPSGCVDKLAGVNACSAAGPDAVLVSLKASGIALPAGGSVDVATIRLEVIDTENVVQLGLKGMSDPSAIRACSSSTPSVCASCDATGCTTLVLGRSGEPLGCPHACPERIIFRGDAATPDFFEFHGLIRPGSGIDPATEGFALSLSNALFAPIFSFALPPGAFKQQGSGTFTYRDNGARKAGGIAFVKISRRDGPADEYKIDIQAFDAGLASKATQPVMTVEFEIGDDPFQTTNTWIQKPNGWFVNLPK